MTDRIQLNPPLPGTFCGMSDWELWASVTSSIEWRFRMAWFPKSLPVSNVRQILISSEISKWHCTNAELPDILIHAEQLQVGSLAPGVQFQSREQAQGSRSWGPSISLYKRKPHQKTNCDWLIWNLKSQEGIVLLCLVWHFKYRLDLIPPPQKKIKLILLGLLLSTELFKDDVML